MNKKRTLEAIERHLISLKDKPDVVVIDYLHLLGVEGLKRSDEYSRITAISNGLKNLAESTDIPVVALSQVSNESAKSQSQATMGYKGSGSIAFDCDVGIELWREYEKETTDHVPFYVNLRKNRYGPAPKLIVMEFDKSTGFIL